MNLKSEYIKLTQEERLYQVTHPVIGLTGGIATGKSTVAGFFSNDGIPVISADALVKEVYKRGETKDFIKREWPEAIINEEINFPTLRKIAFSEDSKRSKIEKFIYARMPEVFETQYNSYENSTLMIYDVPLLFEKNLAHLVDISVCVYAPREVQIDRLVKRDSIEKVLAEQILGSQIDIEDKKEAADFIIENTGSLEDLKSNYKKFLKKVTKP